MYIGLLNLPELEGSALLRVQLYMRIHGLRQRGREKAIIEDCLTASILSGYTEPALQWILKQCKCLPVDRPSYSVPSTSHSNDI